ncbi:hypothetical protein [Vibrio sp. 10N.239.311.D11]|uniref:hypothetical protein n=1 Tax=Vibrio sp. 10N.239.311.D11 TaxID=3229975 RepID=UPI00355389D4
MTSSPKGITYNGITYDLSHLQPKDHTYTLKDGTVISATLWFSNHCYTEELKGSDTREGRLIIEDQYGNDRYFCPNRYKYSQQIDNWLPGWIDKKCFESKDTKKGVEHWIIVEDHSGMKVKVAFSAKKHNKKANGLAIHIKTIHPYDWSTPPDAENHPQVGFDKLAKSIAMFGSKPKAKKPKKLVLNAKKP